ncbi:superoxide dismutase family protein [Gelidibacter sp. F2691]|nr:superoxide dismutase family protein [Gelidibacter sp. F2691]
MKKLMFSLMLVLPTLFFTSCSDDDDATQAPEESKTYELSSVADPSISGTAKFIKVDEKTTTIELQLKGTPSGGMHPAHIHFNTAAEGGEIALTLGTVDGTTGFSTVTVTALDNKTAISYEKLLEFDGYINVHASSIDLATLVAQGDIGENELTGLSTSYPLASVSDPAISGSFMIEKRANGEALATITLKGTKDGVEYPAHIHAGSVANAPGAITVSLNSVKGKTGMSKTNLKKLNASSDFYGYEKLLTIDGYVNVHNPMPADLSVLVAQGNVGKNK